MTAGRSRVVLHIGGQKCGSSALQGYLFFGRYKLAAAGIIYLDMDLGTDPGRAKSHSALIPDLVRGGPDWVRKCLAALDWQDPDCCYVISSEGFCSMKTMAASSAALAPLAEFGDVHIVFYVRPQSEVIYSGWQQWGLDFDFPRWVDDALRRDFANWNLIWKTWSAALPTARFTTRVFARDLFPEGDIVADFSRLTGFPKVALGNRKKANPTFDDLTALALRSLAFENGLDPKQLMIAMKKAGVELPRSPANLVLSDESMHVITAHYAGDNEQFLELSGMDAPMIERFRQSRIPPMEPIAEDEVVVQRRRVADAIRNTPGLDAYSGLRA